MLLRKTYIFKGKLKKVTLESLVPILVSVVGSQTYGQNF